MYDLIPVEHIGETRDELHPSHLGRPPLVPRAVWHPLGEKIVDGRRMVDENWDLDDQSVDRTCSPRSFRLVFVTETSSFMPTPLTSLSSLSDGSAFGGLYASCWCGIGRSSGRRWFLL